MLNDKRYKDGLLVENTDDWYGQRKDGTVDFCGEAVSNFETFPGDNPARPERLNTDGQWKTGRDGDPSGTYILGSLRVGDVHRSEFSPGNAEDTIRYLSTSYGYGSDTVLDQHVPRDLVDLFFGDHDCWVSGENTGLEPGTFQHKYYARGVGFILGVDLETGESVQLGGLQLRSAVRHIAAAVTAVISDCCTSCAFKGATPHRSVRAVFPHDSYLRWIA